MTRRSAQLGCALVLASAVAGLSGCGPSHTPGDVTAVQSYLTSLADGQYAAACRQLDARTRRSLPRVARTHGSCPAIFTRCLPYRALKLDQDQSQLLYATVVVTRHGSHADATVTGTATARAIRRVTLADAQGRWQLTSPGDGLVGCRLSHRRYRRGHGGRTAGHPAAAKPSG